MSPTVIAFIAVFFVVWVASMAWPIEVLLLLRQLRQRYPDSHENIVAPFSRSWTVMWNPAAIIRVLRFVWRRQDGQYTDLDLSLLVRRMRLTLQVVLIGWPVLLVLLVAIVRGPSAA